MPETNDTAAIWKALRDLELRLNTHKHTKADLTAAIAMPDAPYVPGIYTGFVNSDGTAGAPFPDGWTVSRPNTGEYLITHNLGSTDYVVIPGLINNVHVGTLSRSTNTLTLIFNANVSAFGATNTEFSFIIIKP